MSQKEMILEYLREKEWIDPMSALIEIGTMKLSTRISELKDDGYIFKDEFVYYENFKKQEKHYKRYKLIGGNNETCF